MGEESEDPNPNPNPTPSRGEGREGVGRDPNPNPNPKMMGHDESFEGDTEATPRGTLGSTHNKSDPKETPSSYSIGLITQHDDEIHDNDIIMNTIADSGADIDVISGKERDSYNNITRLVNTTLNGMGGASRVHESADHEHLEGLHTTQDSE